MRLLDLFSGIGGFSLAAQWVWGDELEIVSFCEIDKFCQKVLKKHWPTVPIISDIREVTKEKLWQIYAQSVGKDQSFMEGRGRERTVENAEIGLQPNGATSIENNIGNTIMDGPEGKEMRFCNSTETSVSVVEKCNGNFLPLTTKIMMGIANEKFTREPCGNSQSKEGFRAIIKSFASTATMQKPSTENAHMRPNNEKVLENSASSDGGGEGGNPFHERGRTRQGRRKSISENAQGNAYITKPNNKSTGFDGIDILTAGIPCQPVSCAGKRRGKEDDRWLWEETFQIIRTVHPRWCILENVRGLLSLGNGVVFDNLLSELESYGYEVQAIIIPACAVNAPHRRDRVWIVGYSPRERFQDGGGPSVGQSEKEQKPKRSNSERSRLQRRQDVADLSSGQSWKQTEPEGRKDTGGRSEEISSSDNDRMRMERARSEQPTTRSYKYPGNNWWSTEPDVGRVAHGIPNRVDRLKSLGNAIVPQVAEQIFRAIKEIEEGDHQ